MNNKTTLLSFTKWDEILPFQKKKKNEDLVDYKTKRLVCLCFPPHNCYLPYIIWLGVLMVSLDSLKATTIGQTKWVKSLQLV